MGSRLDEYRRLLRHLRDQGYRFCTLGEFVETRHEEFDSPVCLLRNDVDSDPAAAARMFACDREAGVRATYYFRLATLDAALAREIESSGAEVGYHFEEIASFAKSHGLTTRTEVDAHIDAIRQAFRENVRIFSARTGVIPRTVASHGDFINRRIGVPNHHLLTPELMEELGIIADAYDSRLHAGLVARFSDCPPPTWWRPANPLHALTHRPATISILVHPRQWHCNPALNLRIGMTRFRQEAMWRLRSANSARRKARPERVTTGE